MNYVIDTNSRLPAYIQLYNYFVRDIIAGIYPYGSKLPSKRIIADEVGVSVITSEHTMTILADEGYVEARQRSGYYVTYRKSDFQITQKDDEVNEIEEKRDFNSASNIAGAFPYSVLAKTIRKVLLDYGDSILVKSPNHGSTELRAEICSYLRRSRGLQVEPSQIIIGSGAEYLYGLIAQLFGSGSSFAIEDPCYEKIAKVYESMGIKCERLKLYKDGISAADLLQTTAKVLHVTPFNSYPSGISIGITKKQEYLHWAKEKNRVIVEDNYDSELTVSSKPEDALFSLAGKENVIYINTFSKTIAPSIRIGYMVLPKSMVGYFDEKLGFYSCTVPLLDQYTLAQLIRNGDYERHINRIRRKRRTDLLS